MRGHCCAGFRRARLSNMLTQRSGRHWHRAIRRRVFSCELAVCLLGGRHAGIRRVWGSCRDVFRVLGVGSFKQYRRHRGGDCLPLCGCRNRCPRVHGRRYGNLRQLRGHGHRRPGIIWHRYCSNAQIRRRRVRISHRGHPRLRGSRHFAVSVCGCRQRTDHTLQRSAGTQGHGARRGPLLTGCRGEPAIHNPIRKT